MQGAASSAPTSKTGFCRDAACCILSHESRRVINVCAQKLLMLGGDHARSDPSPLGASLGSRSAQARKVLL